MKKKKQNRAKEESKKLKMKICEQLEGKRNFLFTWVINI